MFVVNKKQCCMALILLSAFVYSVGCHIIRRFPKYRNDSRNVLGKSGCHGTLVRTICQTCNSHRVRSRGQWHSAFYFMGIYSHFKSYCTSGKLHFNKPNGWVWTLPQGSIKHMDRTTDHSHVSLQVFLCKPDHADPGKNSSCMNLACKVSMHESIKRRFTRHTGPGPGSPGNRWFLGRSWIPLAHKISVFGKSHMSAFFWQMQRYNFF